MDEPTRRRIQSREDLISLDLSDCAVDALAFEQAITTGVAVLGFAQLRDLCDLFAGDFLEGLELGRSPQLDHWLSAQRRHYRACQEALLKRLQEPDGPEIIAVMRLSTEGWLEAPSMGTLRTVLLRKLRDADQYGHFHP